MTPELNSYFELFYSHFDFLKDVLQEIGDDSARLNWRSTDPQLGSVFSTIAYVALNTEFWIGHVLGSRLAPPGFDNVLEMAQGDDQETLRQLLNKALQTTREVLDSISGKNLDKTFDYADELYSPRGCILQVLDETAQRCGEVAVLRRWAEVAAK